MANSTTIQLIEDGQRHTVAQLMGRLDSSDESYTVVIDVASLSSMTTDGFNPPKSVRIREMRYTISDGMIVHLWWDTGSGTGVIPLADCYGRLYNINKHWGDLKCITPGATGNIGLSTEGWQTGSVMTYEIVLELIKTNQGLPAQVAEGGSLQFNQAQNAVNFFTFLS